MNYSDCVRKMRSSEAYCSSDDCVVGDIFGKDGEEEEEGVGEKVEYRDGVRVGTFCS